MSYRKNTVLIMLKIVYGIVYDIRSSVIQEGL